MRRSAALLHRLIFRCRAFGAPTPIGAGGLEVRGRAVLDRWRLGAIARRTVNAAGRETGSVWVDWYRRDRQRPPAVAGAGRQAARRPDHRHRAHRRSSLEARPRRRQRENQAADRRGAWRRRCPAKTVCRNKSGRPRNSLPGRDGSIGLAPPGPEDRLSDTPAVRDFYRECREKARDIKQMGSQILGDVLAGQIDKFLSRAPADFSASAGARRLVDRQQPALPCATRMSRSRIEKTSTFSAIPRSSIRARPRRWAIGSKRSTNSLSPIRNCGPATICAPARRSSDRSEGRDRLGGPARARGVSPARGSQCRRGRGTQRAARRGCQRGSGPRGQTAGGSCAQHFREFLRRIVIERLPVGSLGSLRGARRRRIRIEGNCQRRVQGGWHGDSCRGCRLWAGRSGFGRRRPSASCCPTSISFQAYCAVAFEHAPGAAQLLRWLEANTARKPSGEQR